MKRILAFFLIISIALAFLCSCEAVKYDEPNIVALNFPSYDFAKNIVGSKASVSLLLPPGGESHTYEPTAKDIIKISECDVLIYNGSESDHWVDDILASLNNKPEVIKMMDFVDICQEGHLHEGHSHEIDEHIWTSLKNSAKVIEGICNKLCRYNKDNTEFYRANANKYISEINQLDKNFEKLFANSKRKTIVVADRFPFTYFAKDYGLEYFSAYHSCTEDSEPTPTVIGRLIDEVKSEDIPVVFYIEFSNRRVATAVSEDTGAKTAELHSCHSVTKQQLTNGTTYVDLMKNNYKVLKEAVNL